MELCVASYIYTLLLMQVCAELPGKGEVGAQVLSESHHHASSEVNCILVPF